MRLIIIHDTARLTRDSSRKIARRGNRLVVVRNAMGQPPCAASEELKPLGQEIIDLLRQRI